MLALLDEIYGCAPLSEAFCRGNTGTAACLFDRGSFPLPKSALEVQLRHVQAKDVAHLALGDLGNVHVGGNAVEHDLDNLLCR